MDARIYVMTHKKITSIPDPLYIPLHVGRAGKESLGYLGDDTGDNISEKNASYCELTGIYWLWKNVKCDVVGICHYRRYFSRNGRLLDRDYIEKLLSEYEMIIPGTCCVGERHASAYAQYAADHFKKDLDICRDVIAWKHPEYLDAFDVAMSSCFISPGNMWIAKKELYDQYCEWLFDILFEAETRIDTMGYDAYQMRVMGFLAERLFRVWVMMQDGPVREEEILVGNPEQLVASAWHGISDSTASHDATPGTRYPCNISWQDEIKFRMIQLKLSPLIDIYKTRHSLARHFSCEDDFDGKIPVWFCWWAGEDAMPETVRLCYESLKRNILEDCAVLRLVTAENCLSYVTFTDEVLRLDAQSQISEASMTDMLMAELMYRYGGAWVSAGNGSGNTDACFISEPMPPALFSKKFYTPREAKPAAPSLAAGRWSNGFWIAERGQKIFQFAMEALWYLAEKAGREARAADGGAADVYALDDGAVNVHAIDDGAADAHTSDHGAAIELPDMDEVMAVAVTSFQDVSDALDECGWYDGDPHLLESILNRKWETAEMRRKEDVEKYQHDGAAVQNDLGQPLLYWIDTAKPYRKCNMVGDETVYGRLLSDCEM